MTALARTRALLRMIGPARRKTPGRVPRQQRPDRLVDSYADAITAALSFIRPAFAPLMSEGPSLLASAVASRERMLRGDAFDEAIRARAILEQIRRELEGATRQLDVEALAARVAAQTQAFNRAQLSRQVKSALGVDVFGAEPALRPIADAFVSANVTLIRGVPAAVMQQIEGAVMNAVQDGKAWGTLAEDLEARFGFPERRAEFIARDQIGKIYGQTNAARQRSIGVTHFTWWCVDDERVRGKPGGRYPNAEPSHWARHGQVYAYDDPPDGELPGEAILCRCNGEPELDALIDD